MRLKGRLFLGTGGASGIGLATAIRCAQEGATVIIMDIAETAGKEAEGLIRTNGSDCLFLHGDVSQTADWLRVMGRLEADYGRLDVLFNNAGTNLMQMVTDLTEKEWDALIDVNLKGVFLGSKYAIPLMRKNGGGSIINTASTLGLIAMPRMPAYCASKGGVIALTRQVALEYATQGIRVNCICPGPVLTPRMQGYLDKGTLAAKDLLQGVPMGRFARPEEIAALVAFLASSDASYITGATICIDGGQTVL